MAENNKPRMVDADKLIERIRRHGETVTTAGIVGETYYLAHVHIIELIATEAQYAEFEQHLNARAHDCDTCLYNCDGTCLCETGCSNYSGWKEATWRS